MKAYHLVAKANEPLSLVPPDQVAAAVQGVKAVQYLGVVLLTLLLYDICAFKLTVFSYTDVDAYIGCTLHVEVKCFSLLRAPLTN